MIDARLKHAKDVDIIGIAKQTQFRGRVLGIAQDVLVVADPGRTGLAAEDVVKVVVATAGGLFEFRAKIRERIAVPVAAFVLMIPKGIEPTQRRQFVRIEAQFPVTFTYRVPNQRAPIQARCTSVDVSGGGLRVMIDSSGLPIAPTLHMEGDLEMQLSPDEPTIACRARVTRSTVLMGKHLVSVEFLNLSGGNQSRITKVVFALQAEKRRTEGTRS